MGKKRLRIQPLVYALIVVEFTSLPKKLSDFIENIHSSLMQGKFKFPKKVQELAKTLYIDPSNENLVQSNEEEKWHFISLDKRQGIFISASRIGIKTTKYTSFEDIQRTFINVIDTLVDSIPILSSAGIQRVGMRYIDVIFPVEANDSVEQYLTFPLPNPLVHSGLDQYGKQTSSNLISHIETKTDSKLKFSVQELRASQQGILILPSDLMENANCAVHPEIKEHWLMLGDRSYVMMDIDHYKDNLIDMEFSSDKIRLLTEELYPLSKELFWSSLSDLAFERYGLIEDGDA